MGCSPHRKNKIGIPIPGETILLGAGFILGNSGGSLWQPMAAGTAACFMGGNFAFWVGRRLGHAGLEKIHWLHLTPERLKWPDHLLKRHGTKSVFIARFIAVFPPAAGNVLAGMTKMTWPTYLFYNFTGSAASTAAYILLGYFFGRQWKLLEAWLGTPLLYTILSGIALLVLWGFFRRPLSGYLALLFSRKRRRKF